MIMTLAVGAACLAMGAAIGRRTAPRAPVQLVPAPIVVVQPASPRPAPGKTRSINAGYVAVCDTGDVHHYDGPTRAGDWKRAFELAREAPVSAGWTFLHDGQQRGRVDRTA